MEIVIYHAKQTLKNDVEGLLLIFELLEFYFGFGKLMSIYYEGKKLRLNTDYSLVYPDESKPGAYAAPCTAENAWKIKITAKGNNYKDSFTISEVLFENTSSSNHIPLNSGNIKVTLASTRVEYQNESTEEKRFWPKPTLT